MKLTIKNFGPITNVLSENGFMEIANCTMIIGPQGSGKSILTKALSTLMWIEKALVRGDFTVKELKLPGRFKARFDFHNIKSCFSTDTVMEYIGSMYHIAYRGESTIYVEQVGNLDHCCIPKILYVPSERNVISMLPKLSVISDLPRSLASFLDEYDKARKALNGELALPVNDFFFSYDRLNDISWVQRNKSKTKLSEAASGFQSLIPMLLASSYLAKQYMSEKDSTEEVEATCAGLSSKDLTKMREEIQALLAQRTSDTRLSDMFNSLLTSMTPSYFINIVEEPEQNLFPDTQVRALYSLLSSMNLNEKNKLIVTTHSPYLLSSVTLAVASKMVYEIKDLSVPERKELENIVPENAAFSPEQLLVYKTDELGNISLLEDYDGLPTDDNYLNNTLGDFNEDYSRILEMGDCYGAL